jgi:uncharacterized protein involved in tolerance to divalent cations
MAHATYIFRGGAGAMVVRVPCSCVSTHKYARQLSGTSIISETVYLWKGKVERETETLLMIKTTNDRFDALRERLCELHPYELPKYLRWVHTCTRGNA